MAFKTLKSTNPIPTSPEELFQDLRGRKYPGLLSYQADILREYVDKAIIASDVAFQLPTGSGKTLVGLLLGEWRRRNFNERIVYLCPTNQLVHQVVTEAKVKYGLKVNAFTGKKSEYDKAAKGEYLNNETIAVTSYSGLFNTNPFFEDPHIIILDDAHSAENYIADHWSVSIESSRQEHLVLHTTLVSLLMRVLSPVDYHHLTSDSENVSERTWVNKIPTPTFQSLISEMSSIIDAHAGELDLRFSWGVIRENLHACHLYLNTREILIRPIIPPTNTHRPFAQASQRIYMSATLGEGGELERLTGRKSIKRLQTPPGWEKQSIGRRLFFFPERSLSDIQSEELVLRLINDAGRALVLVPSEQKASGMRELINARLNGFTTFSAREIEQSKEAFISNKQAVSIVANRYDGIDFPDDECRLLIVKGLPRATNLQELFLISRMGAVTLLNDRILTRIQQAFGRCTRAATDYAAVAILGEELSTYLLKREMREFLNPELQSELNFGLEQSKNSSIENFRENFQIFFEQGEDWSQADIEIVADRSKFPQKYASGVINLRTAVEYEIDYLYAIWHGNFEVALESCRSVLSQINDSNLRGYRAWWNYLAGSAAWLGFQAGIARLETIAQDFFNLASAGAPAVPWLVPLSRSKTSVSEETEQDFVIYKILERLENQLEKHGIMNDHRYAQAEKFILDGLSQNNKERFEPAQVELGRLLGFESGNQETTGAPDPWWIADETLCFIFEDHSNASESSSLDVTKARQVSSHPNWVRENLQVLNGADIVAVLVTPVVVADIDALPHLKNVCLWKLDEFRKWATNALRVIRELRRTFTGAGDLQWREIAANAYKENRISPKSLADFLRTQPASELLKRQS